MICWKFVLIVKENHDQKDCHHAVILIIKINTNLVKLKEVKRKKMLIKKKKRKIYTKI